MTDAIDTTQFVDDFVDESADCLDRISAGLLEMETGDLSSYRTVARDLHTLKGLSACLGFDDVSRYCHQIEDRMVEAVDNDAERIFDHLSDVIGACDILEQYTQCLGNGSELPDIPDFSLDTIADKKPIDRRKATEDDSRRRSLRFLSDVREVTVLSPVTAHVLNESLGGIGLSFAHDCNYQPGQEIQMMYKGCLVVAIVRWSRLDEDGCYQVGLEWKK